MIDESPPDDLREFATGPLQEASVRIERSPGEDLPQQTGDAGKRFDEVQARRDASMLVTLGPGGKARHLASAAVDRLYEAALVPRGIVRSLADAERWRQAYEMRVLFGRIDDLLEPFRDNEHYMVILYEQLLKLIDATHALGAPAEAALKPALLAASDMANVAAMRGSTVKLLERIIDRIAPGYEPEPWEKKLAKHPLWKDDPAKNAADLLTGVRYLDRLVGDDVFGLVRLHMSIDAAYKLGAARVSAGARVERSKRAKFESAKLLSVVTVVLDNNPGLKPQAKIIRPKVLETMGLPEDAASPSIKAVREALCVINWRRAPEKTAAL